MNTELLRIRSRDVLDKIEAGDTSWEELVPSVVAEVIKRKELFGWSLRRTDLCTE